MEIRKWINEHQFFAAGIFLAAAAASLVIAVPHLGARPTWSLPTKGYFTTDDGTTCFVASLTKIPPFDHDGKEAVRDFVYSCDEGKHRWVAYLGKYTAKEKEAIESGRMKADDATMLVKAPGSNEWIPQSSPKFSRIFVQAPPGMGEEPPALVSP